MPERAIPWRSRLAAAVLDRSPDWGALAVSRVMGKAARVRVPRPLSKAAISAYVRYFNVDLAEVDPVRHQEGYDTFDAFFTRKLRDGARPVSRAARTVIAPSDGLVREVLPIEGGVEIRAKGTEYTLGDLLASDELAREFVGGTATTIYLHPRDYHRVHCPCDALALEVVHIPGRMLPVNDAALAREPRLFARNERIVHVLETMHGKMVVVMIAAFGVGHMSCAYRRLEPHPQALVRVPCDPPARLRKADELGVFHLGSTVILVTAPGVHPVGGEVPRRVRMGQALLEGGVSA